MKKEPKQEWKPKEGEEVWIKVFSNWSLGKYIGYDVDKKVHLVREPEEGGGHLFSSPYILHYSALPNEPKQETLEEAARKWYSNTKLFDKGELNAFIAGAKWQAERMYSEVIEFAEWIRIKDFQTTSKNNWIGLDMKYYTTQELFEQFKKK
jgi:hypothetical protein